MEVFVAGMQSKDTIEWSECPWWRRTGMLFTQAATEVGLPGGAYAGYMVLNRYVVLGTNSV